MSWSLPLFRIAGIAVRMHFVFVIYIIIELLRASYSPSKEAPPVGVGPMALLMGCLFLIVLLHEFGHCIACRRTGGVADEVLMWPLGGLAYCRPEHNARSHFITAAGGPLVNVVICVISAIVLGVMTGHWWGVALPNPLDIWGPMYASDALNGWALTSVYFVHALSFVLLLFNLLPLFPMDGGRLLQAALWTRLGYAKSMRIAVRAGFVGAVMLGVFGAVTAEWILIGIAIFGGLTCYQTIRQLNFTNEMLGFESEEYEAFSGADADDEAVRGPSRRERKAEEERQHEAAQVDEILAKIKRSGMESLTAKEKKLLKRATERGRESS